MNILLIEDDQFISDLYKRQLDKEGLATDVFNSGIAGLEALKNKQYNLILLDMMLPQMNGLDILQALKANPQTSSIPVVFLTNMGQESIIEKGVEMGAYAYIIKASYTPKQIVEQVKNILQRLQMTPAAAVQPVPPASPKSVLLVEDDQFIRELYVRILSELSLTVDTAVDGEEGYNKIHTNTYDLILLDVILPKMEGTEILQKLIGPDEAKKKKIVLLSNLDQDMNMDLTQGIKGYLIKSQLPPEKFRQEILRFLQEP